jgi:uncharacterized protein YqgV (UPF0045/DUF77 family)
MTSCQFALYPLGVGQIGGVIDRALTAAQSSDLVVETGPMSTMLVGEDAAVFAALQRAFAAASSEGGAVMTVTISNACPV